MGLLHWSQFQYSRAQPGFGLQAAPPARGFAAHPCIAAAADSGQQKKQTQTALAREQEEFNAITDQIPQRPVGVVEGTSYTIVILAGLAFAGAILYAAVNELLIQPKEYACFNLALEKLRDDPRVTVRLGSPISGYGNESRNRAARQRIPHRTYVDSNGTEHVQVCSLSLYDARVDEIVSAARNWAAMSSCLERLPYVLGYPATTRLPQEEYHLECPDGVIMLGLHIKPSHILIL